MTSQTSIITTRQYYVQQSYRTCPCKKNPYPLRGLSPLQRASLPSYLCAFTSSLHLPLHSPHLMAVSLHTNVLSASQWLETPKVTTTPTFITSMISHSLKNWLQNKDRRIMDPFQHRVPPTASPRKNPVCCGSARAPAAPTSYNQSIPPLTIFQTRQAFTPNTLHHSSLSK